MTRQLFILIVFALLVGLLMGILLQRFYPVGSLLQRIGLRNLLKIPRNIPENQPGYVTPQWDVPPEDRGQLLLFVLMGQSNMSGRGRLNSSLTPSPHPNVYVFNKDFRWQPAREPLGTSSSEVDWVATDGGTGVGPGMAFAHTLLEQHPDLKIGLIPCARGASSIQEWQPDLSQNSLYGACLKHIQAALSYGEIAGVLFSQGESDADDPNLFPPGRISDNWVDKFAVLVNALRYDLHQPDLPVVFSQLGKYPGNLPVERWDLIQKQQDQVKLPNVIMIQTDDLPIEPDAHFPTESQVEIGHRFAQAYLSLASTP